MLKRLWLASEAFWLVLTTHAVFDIKAAVETRTKRIADLEEQLSCSADRVKILGDENKDLRIAARNYETACDNYSDACLKLNATIDGLRDRLTADAAEHARDKQSLTEARAMNARLEDDLTAERQMNKTGAQAIMSADRLIRRQHRLLNQLNDGVKNIQSIAVAIRLDEGKELHIPPMTGEPVTPEMIADMEMRVDDMGNPLEVVRASNYVGTTNAAESDGLPQDEESEGPLFGTLKDGQFHEGVVIEGGLVMRGHPAT